METYGAAKARLFSRDGLRAAVVNLDDDYGRGLFGRIPEGVQAIGTSACGDAAAQVRADALVLDASGIAFDLHVGDACRSEEHTSELQSLMRISYAVFCLKKQTT